MKFFLASLIVTGASAFVPQRQLSSSTALFETTEDLKSLAKELNPVVGFYDPLNLAGDVGNEVFSQTEGIGWLRQAEIKHGRVAMAAFVGYVVQSNFHWPWPMTTAGDMFPSIDLSPEQQWDAIPLAAKGQILGVVGALEFWDEIGGGTNPATGEPYLPHYTKGRKPGQFPSFQNIRDNIHWTADLYDPLGWYKDATEEDKAKGLKAEINNGRLAMLAIMAFISEDQIAGSVPGVLKDIATPYEGGLPLDPFNGAF